MASSTVEDYIKQIYVEQQAAPGDLVSLGKLAHAMGVVPGTATSMVKTLADSGLVSYEPRSGARLTRGGEQLALHVLRRHRLVELFLVKVLGLDWSEVHPEAEELEHAISDKVLERIDALLGRPSVDPHGDPIPSAKGTLVRSKCASLATTPIGSTVRIARIMDQAPGFLQFLDKTGLKPGAIVVVEGKEPAAESITLKIGDAPIALGLGAAAKVMVEEA